MEVTREIASSPIERRVLGHHELITMPINEFVTLPQVRSGLNPELANLKSSISVNGLINPIDVARMEESELRTYIEFVRRTWKEDVSFEDYEHLRQADKKFYMVIAGHSRAEAIRQLQQEGFGSQFDVVAKVHDATSPEHIIELQLSENIHSTPPPERRAIGIVETYLWGQEKGTWKNKKQYIEKKSGVSLDILNEALGFAELPSEARDFVFSGLMSYGAAVELGKGASTIGRYVDLKLGREREAEQKMEEDFDFMTAYRYEIALIMNSIFNRGLNVGASRKFVRGQIALMDDQIGRANGRVIQPEIALFSAAQNSEMYLKDLEKKLTVAMRESDRLSEEARRTVRTLNQKLVENKRSTEKKRDEDIILEIGIIAMDQAVTVDADTVAVSSVLAN